MSIHCGSKKSDANLMDIMELNCEYTLNQLKLKVI